MKKQISYVVQELVKTANGSSYWQELATLWVNDRARNPAMEEARVRENARTIAMRDSGKYGGEWQIVRTEYTVTDSA